MRESSVPKGPFFCIYCGLVYPTKRSQDQHVKLIHPDEAPEWLSPRLGRRKWVRICAVDSNSYGSFGPFIPHSTANPHALTLKRLIVRRGRRFNGKPEWVVWGVPA